MREPINRLDRAYKLWRSEHEVVFQVFLRFADDLLARKRRFGIKMLIERVRWEVHMRIEPDAMGYRLNNNFAPYIARDLIYARPELKNLMETRHVYNEQEEGIAA